MQIKRQNLQKKSYQTVLFCNFQQLKPSYFAYFATINCTKKKHPRYLPRAARRLQFTILGFGDLLDLIVGFPTVEHHADSVVLDRLTFARTKFDEVGSGELGRQ